MLLLRLTLVLALACSLGCTVTRDLEASGEEGAAQALEVRGLGQLLGPVGRQDLSGQQPVGVLCGEGRLLARVALRLLGQVRPQGLLEALEVGHALGELGGALLGTLAILMRRNLHRSQRFQEHHEAREDTSPLLEAFTVDRRETFLALAFAASYGVCYYIAFVYLPEWLAGQGLMARHTALMINTAMMLIVIPAMPLAAVVGDRWLARRTWIALAVLGLALAAWPLHWWMLTSGGSMTSVLVTHGVMFLLLAVSFVPQFIERFPGRKWLGLFGIFGLPIVGYFLIPGGSFGLEEVQSSKWGGLMLTLILATSGLLRPCPLAYCWRWVVAPRCRSSAGSVWSLSRYGGRFR